MSFSVELLIVSGVNFNNAFTWPDFSLKQNKTFFKQRFLFLSYFYMLCLYWILHKSRNAFHFFFTWNFICIFCLFHTLFSFKNFIFTLKFTQKRAKRTLYKEILFHPLFQQKSPLIFFSFVLFFASNISFIFYNKKEKLSSHWLLKFYAIFCSISLYFIVYLLFSYILSIILVLIYLIFNFTLRTIFHLFHLSIFVSFFIYTQFN